MIPEQKIRCHCFHFSPALLASQQPSDIGTDPIVDAEIVPISERM